MEKPNSTAPRRRSRLRRLLRWAEHVLAIVGALFIIYHLCFNISVVTSESMSPTLRGSSAANGEWVLSEKVSYWFRKPRRWEVVLFRNADEEQVMKRVVGLPGEKIALREGQFEINGAAVERPASLAGLKYLPYGMLAARNAAECGKGYFLLGDHSQDSQDSRYDGPLPSERIRGRAWLIVWPLSHVRFVNQ